MKRYISLVALLLVVVSPFVLAVEALPVTIAADHPHVVTMGRFTDDFRFGWTACNARLRFNGTAANVVLELSRGRESAIQVVVDGTPTKAHHLSKDRTVYPLATGLEPGEHTVEIWKRPEGFMGEIKLIGFQLSAGASTVAMTPRARCIMVIGDSISCGYGNEARTLGEGNRCMNENGYMAYGPIAARQLDADIMMVCWSGRGIYRNRSMKNDREGVLPHLFEQTLPLDKTLRWDHRKYVPHVIVINLGTNDLHRGRKFEKQKPELTKEDYNGALAAFVKTLQSHYPQAEVIVSIGPMAFEPITEWLPELAASHPKVHSLVFQHRNGKEYFGGHWHPSIAMDKIMADTLATRIRKIMDWDDPRRGK